MFSLFVSLILSAHLSAWAASAGHCNEFKTAVTKGADTKKLKTFLDAQWKYLMTEYPEWATSVGYPGQDDRWSDYSPDVIRRRQAERLCQKSALNQIRRSRLSDSDKVTYDLAARNLDREIDNDRFDDDYMPVNHMNGFQVDAALALTSTQETLIGYNDIIKRLERFPAMTEQITLLMREGIKRKVMPVRSFMGKISEQLVDLTPKNVEESPLYKPFTDMNPTLKAEDKARLRAQAAEVLKTSVYPALAKFKSFFDKEYAPFGREYIAWTEMPNGKEWYANRVKHHTTTTMTPNDLHELGLREVDRITAEMDKVREQVKFKGDLKAFNKFLLTDKRFRFSSKQELLAGYRDVAKRLDAELPHAFRTLPRLPYGVREIPDFQAKTAAGARYVEGSLATGRAGYFEANTSDLPSQTKWDVETLTMHEAVPGHHLQIAIAQELPGLPEFRRHGSFTSYVEGWALYAETLGKDLGFYTDPYSYYGHLSGQMMRAVRLVVDTGMHAKGWSKEQALAFYRSKFPTTDVDSENEINRYIAWPGQALAYKVGQLKIQELRNKCAAILGERFDLREFHDEILRHGALPMDLLDKTVMQWAENSKRMADRPKTRSAG